MNKAQLSEDVWRDVLDALGLKRDKDEPMIKLVITLETGCAVVVEETKHVVRDEDK